MGDYGHDREEVEAHKVEESSAIKRDPSNKVGVKVLRLLWFEPVEDDEVVGAKHSIDD